MLNSNEKIIYLVLFVIVFIVRKRFTTTNKQQEFIIQKKSAGDILLLAFDGIGMILPVLYVLSTMLDFANYGMPDWWSWLGVVLFIDAIIILYLSHAHLGKNWSALLGIQKEHKLITTGIYKYIRHPMYAAHLLWAVAQIMILNNWIAGFSFFIVMVPHYLLRVGKEEQMMIDQFGEEYRVYMKTTGRILPKTIRILPLFGFLLIGDLLQF
jgi:protein-S-isoprenylcysteine O-methyltransferase Ste14